MATKESYPGVPGFGSLLISDLNLLANNTVSRIVFLAFDSRPGEQPLEDGVTLVLFDANSTKLAEANAILPVGLAPRQKLTLFYNIFNLLACLVGQIAIIVVLVRRHLYPNEHSTMAGMVKTLDKMQEVEEKKQDKDDEDPDLDQSKVNLLATNDDTMFMQTADDENIIKADINTLKIEEDLLLAKTPEKEPKDLTIHEEENGKDD